MSAGVSFDCNVGSCYRSVALSPNRHATQDTDKDPFTLDDKDVFFIFPVVMF